MNYMALVREYFPDATYRQVEKLLFERSPFPFGREESVRAALAKYRCMITLWPGNRGCGLCNNPVFEGQMDCPQCEKALADARHERNQGDEFVREFE